MKKRKLLGFIALLLPMLAGCGEAPVNENEALCKQAIESFPMLINYSDGKELNIIKSTRTAEDMDAYLGLTDLYWNGKQFDIEWKALPEGAWKIVPQTGDSEGYSKFTPIYVSESFDCSLEVTVSLKEGDEVLGSSSAKWNFKADAHIVPDLSAYTYLSLESMNTQFYASTSAFSTSTKYYTFGTITAIYEQSSTHIYNGFIVQDGDYSLYCYQVYENQFFGLNPQVGDKMLVAGTLNNYGGLMEMYVNANPTKNIGFIDFAPADDARVQALAEPKTLNIDTMEWSETGIIRKYISSLVDMTNVTFGAITKTPTVGAHGAFTLIRGTDTIPVSINYHIGTEAYTKLIEAINSWKPGETKLNFHGVVSSYENALSLNPIFGADSFTVAK